MMEALNSSLKCRDFLMARAKQLQGLVHVKYLNNLDEAGMNHPLNTKKRTKSVGAVVTKMKELFNEQYTNQRKPTLFTDPVQTQ